jgi:sulfonate transport system substrate-binding protein
MNRKLRALVALLIAFTIVSLAVSDAYADEKVAIKIGYQRGSTWTILKVQERLEKRFEGNVTVTWTLFPAGPQLLEGLNVGAVDIGATGETPPIFAQAAGIPLIYVAYSSGIGVGQGVIVPKDSPIQTPADLKGKKIAFNKASSAHLLLVRALEKNGLSYNDIEPIFLAPPEARAAFQGGSVDAWVIWDPFLEAAIQELEARILIDGVDVVASKGYTLASKVFVEKHPEIVRGIIEELRDVNDWVVNNRDEYADIQAKETGLDASIWKQTLIRELPALLFIDEEAIAYQQEVADVFFNLKLIPERLNIRDVVWIGGSNEGVKPSVPTNTSN